MSDEKIKYIPLNQIRPNPQQPRKYFPPSSMDSLTRSIERYGVLSPITVRDCGNGKYELITGERRYRAAYHAGLNEIPCIVLDTDGSDSAILSLLENLQREDLTFMEVAESYRSLIKKKGYTNHDLSRKLGEDAYSITEKVRLTRLEPSVCKYIRCFGLSEKQARALLRITDKSQRLDAVIHICDNHLSETETIQFISGLLKSGNEPNIHINKLNGIKLLKNTINDSINIIRKSGVNIEFNEHNYDDRSEFVIIIRN